MKTSNQGKFDHAGGMVKGRFVSFVSKGRVGGRLECFKALSPYEHVVTHVAKRVIWTMAPNSLHGSWHVRDSLTVFTSSCSFFSGRGDSIEI